MGQGDPGREHQGGLTERAATHRRRSFAPTRSRDSTAPARPWIERPRDWLANEVRQIGLEPALEEFSLSRVDPVAASLAVNGRTIEGLPLFDGGFTAAAGIAGALGDSRQRCADRA